MNINSFQKPFQTMYEEKLEEYEVVVNEDVWAEVTLK